MTADDFRMSKYNTISDSAAENTNPAVEVTDKRGYARRWLFSVRTVDNLIREGLPHCKVGRRRVRICIPEADEWMRERFGQRNRPKVPRITKTPA